jgi:hypothetical protein
MGPNEVGITPKTQHGILPAITFRRTAGASSGRIATGVALGFLAVVVGFTALTSGGNDDSDYDSNNKYEAVAQCEARIENSLKSPETAEFDTDATGSGTWKVAGTVDSENGFGAQVRSDFECTVVMNSDSTATTTVNFLTQR